MLVHWYVPGVEWIQGPLKLPTGFLGVWYGGYIRPIDEVRIGIATEVVRYLFRNKQHGWVRLPPRTFHLVPPPRAKEKWKKKKIIQENPQRPPSAFVSILFVSPSFQHTRYQKPSLNTPGTLPAHPFLTNSDRHISSFYPTPTLTQFRGKIERTQATKTTLPLMHMVFS